MTKPVIKKYRLPENLNRGYSIENAKMLSDFKLTVLGTEIIDNMVEDSHFGTYGYDYKCYLHHESGASVVINTSKWGMHLAGSEDSISEAKEDLEKLIGELQGI